METLPEQWPIRRSLGTRHWVRYRFLHVSLRNSLVVITFGGAIVVGIGVVIGSS